MVYTLQTNIMPSPNSNSIHGDYIYMHVSMDTALEPAHQKRSWKEPYPLVTALQVVMDKLDEISAYTPPKMF